MEDVLSNVQIEWFPFVIQLIHTPSVYNQLIKENLELLADTSGTTLVWQTTRPLTVHHRHRNATSQWHLAQCHSVAQKCPLGRHTSWTFKLYWHRIVMSQWHQAKCHSVVLYCPLGRHMWRPATTRYFSQILTTCNIWLEVIFSQYSPDWV